PAAFTPTEMRGTGVFHWQVRGEFPDIHGSKAALGAYTRRLTFIRTIQPPSGARAAIGARSVLISWAPKIGADHYKVEIATSPDFSHKAESRDTETTAFAPTLTSGSWSEGGRF